MERPGDPFFIFGDTRSGTTFLCNLLVTRARVCIPPESGFLARVFERYPRADVRGDDDLHTLLDLLFSDAKFADWELESSALEARLRPELPMSLRDFVIALGASYLDRFFPHATRFGIKKGLQDSHREIVTLFPDVRFLWIVRDGRACFNSKKRSFYSRTGEPFQTDPAEAAREWLEYLTRMREFEELGYASTFVRYETMITSPDDVLAAACAFLGAELAPPDADTPARGYVVPTSRYGKLHENYDKPPIRDRIDAWRRELTRDEIIAFERVAGDALVARGYELAT